MSTFERVRTIVAGILNKGEDQVTPDTHLINDLGADSLDLVELSMAIEERFGISLDDEEALALETVGQIVDCIEAKAEAGTEAKVEAIAGR